MDLASVYLKQVDDLSETNSRLIQQLLPLLGFASQVPDCLLQNIRAQINSLDLVGGQASEVLATWENWGLLELLLLHLKSVLLLFLVGISLQIEGTYGFDLAVLDADLLI